MNFERINRLKNKIDKLSRRRLGGKLRNKPKLPKVLNDCDVRDFCLQIRKFDKNQKVRLLNQYLNVRKAKKEIKLIQRAKGSRGVLTPLMRAEILECFGRFFTSTQILDIINNEWGMKYSYTSLWRFKKKYIEEIKRKQDDYSRDISKARLVHKRARIEELMDLYDLSKEKGMVGYQLKILEMVKDESDRQQLDIVLSGGVNINMQEKIDVDIKLSNIKKLAILEIYSKLPEESRVRLNSSLLKTIAGFDLESKSNNEEIGVLEENSAKRLRDSVMIDNKNEDGKKKSISMKDLLLKRLYKKSKKLNKIKNGVNKRELELRGENL